MYQDVILKKCSSYPEEGKKQKDRNESRGDKYKTNNRMADLSTAISINTLNVNCLNIAITENGRMHFKNK